MSGVSAERVRVKVPATSANLGPGFDSLGIALSMYAYVEIAPAKETTVTLLGDKMQGLPADKSNLLYKIAQRLFSEAGASLPELAITVYSDIPLARGLGSSAAAIVGALGAANALIGEPLTKDELFNIAASIEGHPDNVGPALFGGIVSAVWDGNRASYIRIDPPKQLTTLVAVPAYELSTNKARAALPDAVSRTDAVFNVSRASLLTASLASGRLDLLGVAMQDRLHQPYRAPLVPGLERVLAEACEHGALGAALSGAGPTAIAFVDEAKGNTSELESFMREAMGGKNNERPVELIWLKPASEGLEMVSAAEPMEKCVCGGASR